MQIQVTEGKITGFAVVGGFAGGIHPATVPEGFCEGFAPGKYLYQNGQILENPDYTAPNYTAAERIRELKKMLADTDYQAIKFAEGWLTEEEYASIRAARQAWRDEINSLEGA